MGQQFPVGDAAPRLQHDDFGPAFAEFFCHDAAGGARPNDANVEAIRTFTQRTSLPHLSDSLLSVPFNRQIFEKE